MKKPTTVAVFIAYNASKTLKNFYDTFPKHLFDKIILVDDASKDGTFELAKSLGIQAYHNTVNQGYGGNMKRALSIGLQLGGDVFVDIHPDGEYLPTCIPEALKKVEDGAEFILGNRFKSATTTLQNGMYFWKILPIWCLNALAQFILQTKIRDMHQGFRVYTRQMLEKVGFETNSDGYIFSFEVITQAVYSGIPISQVTVDTRYSGEKRGASLKHSILYSLGTLKTLLIYLLAKWGVPQALFKSPTTSIDSRTKPLSLYNPSTGEQLS